MCSTLASSLCGLYRLAHLNSRQFYHLNQGLIFIFQPALHHCLAYLVVLGIGAALVACVRLTLALGAVAGLGAAKEMVG